MLSLLSLRLKSLRMMKENILVAMSGGVDSAVCALILKNSGFSVSGATMRLFVPQGADFSEGENDAEAVCRALEMDFSVFDMRTEFRNAVIDSFCESYIRGETPNPCIVCNKEIKFGLFSDRAKKEGFEKIATGHYAKIEKCGDRYVVKRAEYKQKDQSYMLWSLNAGQLARAYLPLGALTKEDVREMAQEAKIPVANKGESQDICFVPDGDYAGFIERTSEKSFPHGDFTDTNGAVLGTHKGLIHYTVGQRRGLGLSLKAPLYVKAKDAENNRVILCPDEGLYTKTVSCHSANWIACDVPTEKIRVTAKVRYRHEAAKATVTATGDRRFLVEFDEPQRAITPGQSCVLYDGDTLVGGGIIE